MSFPDNKMNDDNNQYAEVTLQVPYEVLGRQFTHNAKIKLSRCNLSGNQILYD